MEVALRVATYVVPNDCEPLDGGVVLVGEVWPPAFPTIALPPLGALAEDDPEVPPVLLVDELPDEVKLPEESDEPEEEEEELELDDDTPLVVDDNEVLDDDVFVDVGTETEVPPPPPDVSTASLAADVTVEVVVEAESVAAAVVDDAASVVC